MLTITAVTAVALCLLITALSLNISRLRIRYRISYGHGNHKDLEVAVRAHGNALEQAVLMLILLGLLEGMPADTSLLQGLAIGFVVARVLHAGAALSRQLLLRQVSHAATVLLQLACACAIVWKVA
jgi:uncharacterized protein